MVEIIPYQTRWPNEFQQQAHHLRQTLGAAALHVDHIGSTSVPDLAAKDVIDIQVTVEAVEPDDAYVGALQAASYVLCDGLTRDHRPPGTLEPDGEWEKRLFNELPGQRRTNIHVRGAGLANQRYALLFRDYLRAHPAAAAAFAEVKRRLAARFPEQLRTYAKVKDPVCDIIMVSAHKRWVNLPSLHTQIVSTICLERLSLHRT